MEYYVSVQYTDVEIPHIEPVMENQHIGLDVGIKNTVTTSTGQTYHLPKKIEDISEKNRETAEKTIQTTKRQQ